MIQLLMTGILPLSAEYSTMTKYFPLDGIDLTSETNVFLLFQTNSMESVPLSVSVQFVSSRVNYGVVYGGVVLVVMSVVFSYLLN